MTKKRKFERKPASMRTVFIMTLASMICHPITFFLFLLSAMHGKLPWQVFVVSALVFALKTRKKLMYQDLKNIDIPTLSWKCWVGMFG